MKWTVALANDGQGEYSRCVAKQKRKKGFSAKIKAVLCLVKFRDFLQTIFSDKKAKISDLVMNQEEYVN